MGHPQQSQYCGAGGGFSTLTSGKKIEAICWTSSVKPALCRGDGVGWGWSFNNDVQMEDRSCPLDILSRASTVLLGEFFPH